MTKSVQNEFDQIAEETQSLCDSVKCSREDYLEGLEIVIPMLESAADCTREELRRDKIT
jgi:hypothetical protein